MTFKLTNRLLESLNLLPKNSCYLDIGADRGYLAIFYASSGNKVYASENKVGPFNILKKTIALNNSSVIPLFGDGLDILPSDVETLSILGMGGNTISKILLDGKNKLSNIKYILVSPQSSTKLVIHTLNDLGFKNTNGKYIFESHYYPILFYEKGEEKLNELELLFGKYPLINKDPNLKKFIDLEINRYSSIGYKLTKSNAIIYNNLILTKEKYFN